MARASRRQGMDRLRRGAAQARLQGGARSDPRAVPARRDAAQPRLQLCEGAHARRVGGSGGLYLCSVVLEISGRGPSSTAAALQHIALAGTYSLPMSPRQCSLCQVIPLISLRAVAGPLQPRILNDYWLELSGFRLQLDGSESKDPM